MSEQTVERELWGGETTKAVKNFQVSGERIPAPVVHWLGRIKAAAARVNGELGQLDPELAERVAAAGDEVADGRYDDQRGWAAERSRPGKQHHQRECAAQQSRSDDSLSL